MNSPRTVPDSEPTAAGDCDDADPWVHPSRSDPCKGRDDDCDGSALAHTHGDLAPHSVDLCGGTIAQIGPTGAGNACGIVRGAGGLLWGTGTHSGQRVQLNPSTGISEDVAGVEHELGNCDMA